MVKCSIFGASLRNGQKKKGSKASSLSREETIASAFFCKCKRVSTIKSTTIQPTVSPSEVDVKAQQVQDEDSCTFFLAPLL
jgi:hypothetical protein